jgi:hypothetical protein
MWNVIPHGRTSTAVLFHLIHADRVTTCGIDRWLGGVHLKGGGRIWRWDERQQRIV